MRTLKFLLLTLTSVIIAATPNFSDLQTFLPALLHGDLFLQTDPQSQNLSSFTSDHDLSHRVQRRQANSGCGTSYSPCAALNAPGLCCTTAAICSADNVGNVACCPLGAACTGTVGAYANTATGVGYYTTATTTQGYVLAITTDVVVASNTAATGGFIAAAGSTVAVLPGAGARCGGRSTGVLGALAAALGVLVW